MKKKRARHTRRHTSVVSKKPTETYLVVVRSWMLVVLFAIMLGVGAVVGTFLNTQFNGTSAQVAGVETEAR